MRRVNPLELGRSLPERESDSTRYLEETFPRHLKNFQGDGKGVPPRQVEIASDNGTRKTGWYSMPFAAEYAAISLTFLGDEPAHLGAENPMDYPTAANPDELGYGELRDYIEYSHGCVDTPQVLDYQDLPEKTLPEWLEQKTGEPVSLVDHVVDRTERHIQGILPQATYETEEGDRIRVIDRRTVDFSHLSGDFPVVSINVLLEGGQDTLAPLPFRR